MADYAWKTFAVNSIRQVWSGSLGAELHAFTEEEYRRIVAELPKSDTR